MSETIRILHLDSNHPLLWQQLEEAGYQNEADYTSSRQEIEKRIGDYQGIVIRSRFTIDRSFLDKAVRLQFIARVGAGLESIDVEYAEEKGIHLIAAPEGNRNAVGEHALGMLLSLMNKLQAADKSVKSGQWLREEHRGYELEGKTVGIIGYGNMGKSFAGKLRGFGVKTLCYDILPNVGDANARQVSLQELREKSDILSLHTPWTPQTDRMIDQKFIDAFAKPFWFINTARGKSVVTDDLVDALKRGKILGAGLDVLEYEKLSFESLFEPGKIPEAMEYLLQSDKVILSPHVAGWTFESHAKLAQVIADKIGQLYHQKPHIDEQPRVTGIGGLFFKSVNPEELKKWYRENLGLNTDAYGCTFWWKDSKGDDATTQWSPFKEDTTYFEPSKKSFMVNMRVNNLEKLLQKLILSGVTIVGEIETYEYGKFGWIVDPEGNKIELWEPIDSAFL